MRFEWDEAKNRQNLAKHRISFELATLVFDDPHALSDLDRVVGDEERWQTIGMIAGVAVFVAHTWWEEEDGEDVIRLISTRRASPAERRHYEAHKKSS
jgi:uncharacterized protein